MDFLTPDDYPMPQWRKQEIARAMRKSPSTGNEVETTSINGSLHLIISFVSDPFSSTIDDKLPRPTGGRYLKPSKTETYLLALEKGNAETASKSAQQDDTCTTPMEISRITARTTMLQDGQNENQANLSSLH